MKKRIKKDKDDPVGGKPGEKGLSMKFLNKLERKFGRYAVPNLMLYIIILNAAGLLITIMYPQAQYYLCWSTSAILHGQIWRIVSFILVPYTTSPVNFLIFAFLYYSISQTLERVWGSFRMDMYIITGLLGTIVAAFLVYFVFGVEMGMQVSISYLSNSLFLALAATFPDVQFLLFFIIPVKAKWMALLSVVWFCNADHDCIFTYKFYTLFPRHERSSADQPQRGTSKKRFSKEDGGEGTKRQATA